MDNLPILLIGSLLTVAGAIFLYVASPNQRLTARAAPKAFGWLGLVLLPAGLAALLLWAGPATAVFIAMTLAMLVWTLVPLAAAWLRARGGPA